MNFNLLVFILTLVSLTACSVTIKSETTLKQLREIDPCVSQQTAFRQKCDCEIKSIQELVLNYQIDGKGNKDEILASIKDSKSSIKSHLETDECENNSIFASLYHDDIEYLDSLEHELLTY